MLRARHELGFTLLEILLVMVLLSLTAVVVVPTFPKSGTDGAKNEAERFYQLIQIWNEQSLLMSKVMGVRFETNSYSLMELVDNDWKKVVKKSRIANSVTMPDDVELEIEVAGGVNQEDQLFSRESLFDELDFNETEAQEVVEPPQLVMMGNGELIPFTLNFTVDGNRLWKVAGTDIGKFKLSTFDEE